ncbi:MAG: N-acetylmuramoyl-L-alanine amidase, partial [Acidobacteria bacterium]|nr:N-acetylmuramoyl-L-alanine amidase [Acidobacteriota bacterium]
MNSDSGPYLPLRRWRVFGIPWVAIAAIVVFVTSPTGAGAQQQGFRTIVIDAGHGGSEVGAVGATGLMEKDIVLDISKRHGQLREKQLG